MSLTERDSGIRPAAGLLRPRVSPGAPSPGPSAPSSPHPRPGTGARRGGPQPLPRRGQCQRTNVPSLPPSPPRAPFFEPDANLTLTSIIRSALSKLVVTPLFPGAPDSTSLLPPLPLPPSPTGEHEEGSKLQDRTSQADRSIRPGPRTHARTHTAPHTALPHPATSPVDCLTHPPPRWPADLVPCSHPRAGGADAALWVPEGPGGSDDPPFPHPDRAERTPHTRENKGAIKSREISSPNREPEGHPSPASAPPTHPPSGRPPPPQASLGQPRFGPSREIRAPDQHQHRGPRRPPVPSNKFLLRLRNAVYTSISIYSTNGFGVLPP